MSIPKEPQQYDFKGFRLRFDSLGVPFLSDKTKEIIANMTEKRAKEVNREAWKQRKEAWRIANRHCNWSVNGNISIYERAEHHTNVAELVCKETYKRMVAA